MRIMLETWMCGRWVENMEFTGENAMGCARETFVSKLYEGVAHRLVVIDMEHNGTSESAETNLRDYHGPSHGREQLEGFNCPADFCGGLVGDVSESDNAAKPLTCANCGKVSTNPGQFLVDSRWVCTATCRKELCDKDSYRDLAASGGIVDAP